MAHKSHVPYKAFDAGQGDDPYDYRPSRSKMQQAQADVDEVVVVMRNNMEKVLERDAKLDDLQDKSESLADGAYRFKTTSRQLKNAMWWKNVRCWVFFFVLLAIVIAIVVATQVTKKKGGGDGVTTTQSP
eukprot:m.135633 g.135633  ORF g.135633 m.135633 type:complete len:130 (+) comp17560_c0_seq1:180-569(+)